MVLHKTSKGIILTIIAMTMFAMQDSLNLKSYTTTQRNALTSAAGDMIYNTTDSKVQFYNGSSWNDL